MDPLHCDDNNAEDALSLAYDTQAYFEDDDQLEKEDDGDEADVDKDEAIPDAASVPQDDGLEEGWCMVSERYQLVRSPRGSIHSRHAPTSEADLQKQHADFEAWLVENGMTGAPENDWSVQSSIPIGERFAPDPDDGVHGEETPVQKVGKKRREPAVLKCHYIGCERVIDQAPLTCPSHQSEQPDYEHVFCSYECMAAWALYEIGDPLADTHIQLINHRAGRKVVPAPSWFDTIITGIDRMKLTGPIDGKGLRLDEDSSSATGSRTHEARLLPDDATVNVEEIAEPMADDEKEEEEDPQSRFDPKYVSCRLCNVFVDNRSATLVVRLHTCAIWAFCSESCFMDHPHTGRGAFMSIREWLDLSRKGMANLLRRDTWGTEPDDVDPEGFIRGGNE
jgi:hypothetical protein